MTASELLKQHILENVLNKDLLEDEEKEWVKTFDDLLELCNSEDGYDIITEFINDNVIESDTRHLEHSRYIVEEIIKLNDVYIKLEYTQDDCWDRNKEYFDRILKGINKASFVKPVNKTITVYESI
jgi:hypothetical protein